MFAVSIYLAAVLALLSAADPPADAPKDPAARPAEAAPAQGLTPDQAAAMAEYEGLRRKAPRTADGHWRLALWCEEHGLPAEAYVHFAEVVRLDPRREAAWKRLGFKKQNNRWVTDEQIADEAEQKEADRRWGARLDRIHAAIHPHGPPKGSSSKKKTDRAKTQVMRREEAETELAKVDDPRAVPAIYREFGVGGPNDQKIAVQLLGQISTPQSSRTLAIISVYGASAEVRRLAVETLRGRNPVDYAAFLVNLMGDLLRYEVRPVGGPGSPGELFVEGQRYSVRRHYVAPAIPNVSYRPGDLISYDDAGMPVLLRPSASRGATWTVADPKGGKAAAVLYEQPIEVYSQRQMAFEAARAALSSQQRLAQDIAQVEQLNSAQANFNAGIRSILKDATGEDPGQEPIQWREWLSRRRGASLHLTGRKPTIDQVVSPEYLPMFGQMSYILTPAPPREPG